MYKLVKAMKTGIYIGRFQPFHEGHRRCVEHILENCARCLILVRETPVSDKNPFGFKERLGRIREYFPDESIVSVLPIEDAHANLCVYIGRDVGYELIQLDEDTEKISATDIRKKMYEDREVQKSVNG